MLANKKGPKEGDHFQSNMQNFLVLYKDTCIILINSDGNIFRVIANDKISFINYDEVSNYIDD